MAKLFVILAPVSVRTPRSNISRTTFVSTLSPTSERGSITLTTRPGNGPGSECAVLGTFMKSAMFVSTSGGFSLSSPNEGTPSTNPPATAAAPPITLANSRRFKSRARSMDE
jgi:hypothetical protein